MSSESEDGPKAGLALWMIKKEIARLGLDQPKNISGLTEEPPPIKIFDIERPSNCPPPDPRTFKMSFDSFQDEVETYRGKHMSKASFNHLVQLLWTETI